MRAPTPRRLTLLAAIGGTAGAGAAVLLAASSAVSMIDAAQLAAAALALAGLAVVVLSVRRLDGKVQRLIVKHREHANFTLAAQRQARAFHADARPSLEQTRERSEEILGALGEDRVEAITRTGEMLTRLERRISRADNTIYAQVESFVDLRELIKPRAPMPGLRGWAVSPDVLRALVALVWSRRPKLVVECGSGSSSVWLGYALEHIGGGQVIALEHEERFAEISRDLVRAHALEDTVEIRMAPLEPWRGPDRAYRWYAQREIEDLTGIELLLVDGPPQDTGPQARYPAVPLLLPRCAENVTVILDDTNRPDEKAASDRWIAEYPELGRVVQHGDKGTHILTRRMG